MNKCRFGYQRRSLKLSGNNATEHTVYAAMLRHLKSRASIALTFLGLLGCHGQPQREASATKAFVQPDPSFYKSFYEGRLIRDPEALSGVWETPDGRGGAVGIDLTLDTDLPGNAASLASGGETVQSLEVGIYKRSAATIQLGEENFVTDSEQGGNVRFENGRLTFHSSPFDLDLTRLPDGRWSGRLHRPGFDGPVVLTRPGAGLKRGPRWAGIWLGGGNPALPECLHLAQAAEGEPIAWLDRHQLIHSMHFAPGLRRPEQALQSYGQRLAAQLTGNGLLLSSPASSPSLPFSALAVPDPKGMYMHTTALEGNGPLHTTPWKRMPGSSCIAGNKAGQPALAQRK